MDLYYATTNLGKVDSLQRDFGDTEINVVQIKMALPESRSNDVKEIAVQKVSYAYEQLRNPVVALDAAFYIKSLNGFPGTFINFALGTIGLEGILKLIGNEDRNCEFVECLAYFDSRLKSHKFFIGYDRGSLAYEPRGEKHKHLWSELGLIFIPEGCTKTLGQMDYLEYLEWQKTSDKKEPPSRKFCEWFVEHVSLHQSNK